MFYALAINCNLISPDYFLRYQSLDSPMHIDREQRPRLLQPDLSYWGGCGEGGGRVRVRGEWGKWQIP